MKKILYSLSVHEMGIGDWGWGLGIGDWGLGPIPQPPTPNPQPPTPFFLLTGKEYNIFFI